MKVFNYSSRFGTLENSLNNLISKGFKIVSITPTKYAGEFNYSDRSSQFNRFNYEVEEAIIICEQI